MPLRIQAVLRNFSNHIALKQVCNTWPLLQLDPNDHEKINEAYYLFLLDQVFEKYHIACARNDTTHWLAYSDALFFILKYVEPRIDYNRLQHRPFIL